MTSDFGFRISDFGFATYPPGGEPQRHRGTEKTQSHPPTSQTRRHKDTKKSRSRPSIFSNAKTLRREDAKPTRPPHLQRRGVDAGFLCAARSRPPNGGQGPLGQETTPKTSFRPDFLAQRPALCERRPRLFFPLFVGWVEPVLLSYRKKERQNRCAVGAPAGEKTGGDERSRSELMDFSPAAGDLSIAGSSAVSPRHSRSSSAMDSLRTSCLLNKSPESLSQNGCVDHSKAYSQ